jgi:hypothetical protein
MVHPERPDREMNQRHPCGKRRIAIWRARLQRCIEIPSPHRFPRRVPFCGELLLEVGRRARQLFGGCHGFDGPCHFTRSVSHCCPNSTTSSAAPAATAAVLARSVPPCQRQPSRHLPTRSERTRQARPTHNIRPLRRERAHPRARTQPHRCPRRGPARATGSRPSAPEPAQRPSYPTRASRGRPRTFERASPRSGGRRGDDGATRRARVRGERREPRVP